MRTARRSANSADVNDLRKINEAASLDQELKAMFGALQARALPGRIRCVVDQILVVEPQAAPTRKAS